MNFGTWRWKTVKHPETWHFTFLLCLQKNCTLGIYYINITWNMESIEFSKLILNHGNQLISTSWKHLKSSTGLQWVNNTCHFSMKDSRCIIYIKSRENRQRKYCNNLPIRVIPFFIVSKSSVGKTILKTVLPHFFKVPRYQGVIIYGHRKNVCSKHA